MRNEAQFLPHAGHLSMRVAVLGGGVSGLTLSFYLRKHLGAHLHQLYLIEAQKHAGGWVRSIRLGPSTPDPTPHPDPFLFELGPASVRGAGPSAPAVIQLLEDAGLIDEVLGCSPESKRRYLYTGEKLQALPHSLAEVFTSPLTWKLPWIGLWEMAAVSRSEAADESIHEFALRHFGREAAEVLVGGMVSGIYAGDPKRLSVEACMNVLHESEKKDRSVLLSMLKSAVTAKPEYAFHTQRGRDILGTSSLSFVDGMQTLTDALAEKVFENRQEDTGVDARLLTATKVERLEQKEGASGMRVHLSSGEAPVEVDHVFSTLPIRPLVHVLGLDDGAKDGRPEHALASLNKSIEYVSVAKVHLGYEGEKLPVSGLGHLVPSGEGDGILGMLYNNLIFPQQMKGTENERASLTVLCGGYHFPQVAQMPPDKLVEFCKARVAQQIGFDAEPCVTYTQNLDDCIPQYAVGHIPRMKAAMRELKRDFPSLSVIGNHFYGVGVADCIKVAKRTAEEASLSPDR